MTANEYGLRSLRGLWVGDCIGNMSQLYDVHEVLDALEKGLKKYGGLLPARQFNWSDDTEEAIVLYNHLKSSPTHTIDVDKLALEFAKRYMERDPDGETYGYGLMTRKVLKDIYDGVPWWEANRTYKKIEGMSSHVDDLVTAIIEGETWKDTASVVRKNIEAEKKYPVDEDKISSCGNGSAMRIAPLGALLAWSDEKFVAEQAALSAIPTHNHPEGIAGAVAVARMAQLIVDTARHSIDSIVHLIELTAHHVPDGTVKHQLMVAAKLGLNAPLGDAIKLLGNGSHVTCQDTVPLCCWLANRALWRKHVNENTVYDDIIKETAQCGGDVDTNCAIVGGLVGIIYEPSEKWVNLCKPLEDIVE